MLTSTRTAAVAAKLDQKIVALTLVALGAALIVAVYQDTWADMVRMWRRDSTFGHAFLVAPLAAFAAWQRRHALERVALRGSWTAALLMVPAALGWVLGNVLQVAAVEHVALVLMLQLLIWAVLGNAGARVMLFPIAFLIFLAPVGKALVPALMHATADLTVAFCQLTGVPVLREDMFLHIPEGTFEVARACSGVKFLVAAFALSVYVADLMFVSWWRRIAYVALTIVVTVLMNGVRAYVLVLIGHLTDMTWEHDRWHIWLGYAMFGVTLLGLVWLANRFSDHRRLTPEPPASAPPRPAPGRAFGPGICAAAVLLTAPAAAHALLAPATSGSVTDLARTPEPASGWQVTPDVPAWRPHFRGALSETSVRYVSPSGAPVELYVAAYQIGGRGDAEMISYRNRIQSESDKSFFRTRVLEVPLAAGRRATVVETQASQRLGRLVWYWYDIGGRAASGEFQAKMLEAFALLQGRKLERVVVISSTGAAEAARQNLLAFVTAHAEHLETAVQ